MAWPWERPRVPKEAVPVEPVLPFSIRDHFKVGNETLTKELVRLLVRDGSNERFEFVNVALYLVLKASATNPEIEQELLQKLTRALHALPERTDDAVRHVVRNFAEAALEEIPGDWEVGARNLARLSRHGFRNTDLRYQRRAERQVADTRNTFIIGHATFVGLPAFITAFKEANRPLYILIPEFLPKGEGAGNVTFRNHPTGYVIQPDGVVRALTHDDFLAPEGAVIMDDVRNTGATETKVLEYFHRHGNDLVESIPMEDTHGSVI